ncbi:MAG: hypothetical protein JO073_09600 [Actinobacteria bacterium]|nr:hypothetical protein [Actinomycetota bacterium]
MDARALGARLLAFLAFDAVVCVAVAAFAGKLPSGHAVGLASAAAGVLCVLAYAAFTYHPAPASDASESAAARPHRDNTKTFLALMMIVGVAAYFGGNGTYSTFSAETTNAGSTTASGTLTFSDQINSNSACLSVNGATLNNVNAGCGAIFNLTNLAPGVYGGQAQVTLKNTGSIDAGSLYLFASNVNTTLSAGLTLGNSVTSLSINPLEGTIIPGDSLVVSSNFHSQTFTVTGGPYLPYTTSTLSSGLTSGNSVTTLSVAALDGPVTNGDSIVVSSGANTQTFTASASAAAGATSISVTSQTANFSYPSGSTVSDLAGVTNTVTVTSASANYSYPSSSSVSDTTSNGYVASQLSSGLTSGNTVTSLAVNALPNKVFPGDFVTVTSGAHSQAFTASALANAGATSISVLGATANFSYPSASSIVDPNNMDCVDQKTTTAGVVGATKGTDLNFNWPYGNPLCSQMLVYIQETTGGNHYCWVGNSVSTAMCAIPISVTLSSSLSTGGPITSLPVNALNGNVKSGDSIVLTSGSNTQTFTASADAYTGATSISVNSLTPNFAYPTSTTVSDSTMLSTLNTDTSDSVTQFDKKDPFAHEIGPMLPLSGNGTLNNSATVDLGHAGSVSPPDTRVFLVGVFVPSSNNQNAIQGLFSTFGVTWHIDQ